MLTRFIMNSYKAFTEIVLWLLLLLCVIGGGIIGQGFFGTLLGAVLGFAGWLIIAVMVFGAILMILDIRQICKEIAAPR